MANKPWKDKWKALAVWKRSLLIVLAVVVLLTLLVGVGSYLYIHSMLDLVRRPEEALRDPSDDQIGELIGNLEETETTQAPTEEPTEESTEEPTEPTQPDYGVTGKIVNIMVVGQDRREGEDHKLSDTMILCTLNKETKTLTLSSFMRDMYVKLPNMWGHKCGHNRINTAYALGYAWKGDLGAMQMLDQLILEQFGVEVDYNIEIGLEAFETIIDTLGGVDIELTQEEAAYLNRVPREYRSYDDCNVGMNRLNGMAAQYYARMRHATPADSDFNRTGRQRKIINSVIDACRSMSVLELHRLMTELLPYVLTDMSNEEILTCTVELLPYVADINVVSQQIPAEGTYSSKIIEIYDIPSGVLVPDIAKNRQILMAICEESEEAEANAG